MKCQNRQFTKFISLLNFPELQYLLVLCSKTIWKGVVRRRVGVVGTPRLMSMSLFMYLAILENGWGPPRRNVAF